MKAILLLTSGGDAPGMNAEIRAIVRTAVQNGLKVYGVRRGYKGLIENDMYEMDLRSVSDIINRGGTILYSARCKEFETEEGQRKAVESCIARGVDGIVTIGGDGTFRGAMDLVNMAAKMDVNLACIGVPGTIDNDIACSDYTVGFDTTLNTVVDLVDRIRDTCESHDRCAVVEVMGRNAGYLALYGGIAIGATCILIPEKEFDLNRDVVDRINRFRKTGKEHFIVMVAEGCIPKLEEMGINGVEGLARYIEHETRVIDENGKEIKAGVESRHAVLGHCQRGGYASAKDRIVGSQMGNKAVHLLLEGATKRVVAMQHEKVVDLDMEEAVNMKKSIDLDLYDLALEISI